MEAPPQIDYTDEARGPVTFGGVMDMVAKQPLQIPTATQPSQTHNKAPKTFTLGGRELLCYRAGEHLGACNALGAASQDTRKIKNHIVVELKKLQAALQADPTYPVECDLPVLAEGLEAIARNLDTVAGQHRDSASRIMGQVAAQDTAREVRWRPPLRAWGMLTLAMTVATAVSTLGATYASHIGW